MFVWTNFVVFLAQTLQGILQLYFWVVIASAILSWIEPNPYNPIVRFIYAVTEPVLDWVRRRVPVVFGGLDLSPILVIVAIQFLQGYVIPTIERLAISGLN